MKEEKYNKNLLVISGKKGSGKDTFTDFAIEYLKEKGVGEFENRKFATKLKEIASMLTGIPLIAFTDRNLYPLHIERWGMNIRTFLQRLGTNAIRTGLHEETWALALFADLKSSSKWIISDCRFENEAETSKDYGGILIRINRPSVDDGDKHISETSLDNYKKFDYWIDNNGTLDNYKSQIRAVLDEIYGLDDRNGKQRKTELAEREIVRNELFDRFAEEEQLKRFLRDTKAVPNLVKGSGNKGHDDDMDASIFTNMMKGKTKSLNEIFRGLQTSIESAYMKSHADYLTAMFNNYTYTEEEVERLKEAIEKVTLPKEPTAAYLRALSKASIGHLKPSTQQEIEDMKQHWNEWANHINENGFLETPVCDLGGTKRRYVKAVPRMGGHYVTNLQDGE